MWCFCISGGLDKRRYELNCSVWFLSQLRWHYSIVCFRFDSCIHPCETIGRVPINLPSTSDWNLNVLGLASQILQTHVRWIYAIQLRQGQRRLNHPGSHAVRQRRRYRERGLRRRQQHRQVVPGNDPMKRKKKKGRRGKTPTRHITLLVAGWCPVLLVHAGHPNAFQASHVLFAIFCKIVILQSGGFFLVNFITTNRAAFVVDA